MRTTTLTDHARRIARAMALLAERPDRTPSLEELAASAAFSPFHFHRAYRELTGETPMETLARLRLSRAAAALIRSDAPMERVARAAGYGSVAAFTRAFRDAHGIPPGAYRRQGRLANPEEDPMSAITIAHLPPLLLAVLPHRGSYEAIGPVFDRLGAWAAARGLHQGRWFGLYLDDPVSVPEAELRAFAAVSVPEGTVVEAGMSLRRVPALRCAALRHKGPYAELEQEYGRLYGEWLPASGERPGEEPVMEEYLNDPRSLPPAEWLTDILLPLRERVPA